MFDVIIDAIKYIVENYSENVSLRWISILIIAIVLSIIVSNKLTIFVNNLETKRVKPLKEQNDDLERQLATCREKVVELHNKNAELLAKFYKEENAEDEHPFP